MNKLVLVGKLKHIDDKKYVEVATNSGKIYTLPIVSEVDFADGTWVRFAGKLHTRLVCDGRVRHKVWFGDGTLTRSTLVNVYLNDFNVDGTVVSVGSDVRETPLTHRKIIDFVVTDGINYFNCIAFGRAAFDIKHNFSVGSKIVVLSAQLQSRVYDKCGESRTAYEVCVHSFV